MGKTKRNSVAVKQELNPAMTITSELPNEADVARNSSISTTNYQSREIQSESESQLNQLEIMQPDSLDARWLLEHRSVLRELHRALVRQIIFYTKPQGGGLSMEEAISKATEVMDGPEAEDFYKQITSMSVRSISWISIDTLFRYNSPRPKGQAASFALQGYCKVGLSAQNEI